MHQRPALQRKPVDSSLPLRADADVAATLARPSPGLPIEARTRAWLEAGLGHSFANIQIHADSEADQMARAVHASAFTAGQDIYFRDGAYNPDEPAGQHRLAHEAAHVVQQAAGPVAGEMGPSGVSVSHPDDAFERAAESAADGVMAGSRAAPSAATSLAPTPTLSLQREEDDSLWGQLGGMASGALGGISGLAQSAGGLVGGLADFGGFGGVAGAIGGALGGGAGGGIAEAAGGILGGLGGGVLGGIGGGIAGAAGGILDGIGGGSGGILGGLGGGSGGFDLGTAIGGGGLRLDPADLLM